MARFVRFSAFRLAIAYVVLSLGVLGIVAAPLWYAWERNVQGVREELIKDDAQTMSDILREQGIDVLTAVIGARVASQHTGNVLILLSDASSRRLAGNLSRAPSEAGDTQRLFSAIVEAGGRPVEALLLRTSLPGGYDLLVGRSTARFRRLEMLFEYGLAAATTVILFVAVIGGLAIRRLLLAELHGINQTASGIVAGDLSRRLPLSGGADELDLLASTVNRMLDQIEHLVHAVRNVSNAIAHDLRTPLAELRARLETLLITRPSTEKTMLELESAVADVDRVIGIFNALLRLAEIETGARRSAFVELDVADLAREAVEFYQPVAELKGVALDCACASEIRVRGDAVLISQAIGNLIDNAVKYTPKDGRIDVRAAVRGDSACITVADAGPGIAAEDMPRVTERFFRGDSSRGTPGVGLGLSLVAAVATLHRGRLELEDNHPGLRARLVLG